MRKRVAVPGECVYESWLLTLMSEDMRVTLGFVVGTIVEYVEL